MSSSPGSEKLPSSPPEGAEPSISPREDRKRTVPALTSKEAREVPSWACQMRGPPVAGSLVRRPSTSTLLPFLRYWLQVSACLPQAEMRNQVVSLTCSPLLLV